VAWRTEPVLSLLSPVVMRGYPVVLSVMRGDTAAPSSLRPDVIAGRLAEAFLI